MERTLRIASILITLACSSPAKAGPPQVVERGKSITVETSFKSATHVKAAYVTWQTYDDVKPKQSAMARAFGCIVDVAPTESRFSFVCKVPLNVADGRYVLTSITIETDECRREYSFTKDLPADVYIQIKGGPEVSVPNITAISVK